MIRALLLCVTPMLVAGSAAAQTANWANPISESWHSATNWTPSNVPDSESELALIAVAGTYVVEMSNPVTRIGGLTLSNPNATLSIGEGARLRYYGTSLSSNGEIHVNPAGGDFPTSISLEAASCVIDGAGLIRLNANAANFPASATITGLTSPATVLTIGANQTLAGTTRIDLPLVNNGLVAADIAARPLEFPNSVSGNGTFAASTGGTLRLGPVNSTGAHFQADGRGSAIIFPADSDLVGATFTSTNGGSLLVANPSQGGSLQASDLINNAMVRVDVGSDMTLRGSGITNNGTIIVSQGVEFRLSYLFIDAPNFALNGTGSVRLEGWRTRISAVTPGNVWTIGENQTLAGTGSNNVRTVNNGTIIADVSGEHLSCAEVVTNRGLIRATDGGTLSVGMPLGYLFDNEGGEIRADGSGSLIQVAGPASPADEPLTLRGGTLTADNGATLYAGGVLFNGVHKSGFLDITEWCGIGNDGLTNDGLMKVDGSPARLRIIGSPTVDGVGEIEMSDTGWFWSTIAGESQKSTLTLGSQQRLSGSGQILVNTVNNGVLAPGTGPNPFGRIEMAVSSGGRFIQSASSMLVVDLGGTAAESCDRITGETGSVSGGMILDGTLQISLLNNFSPSAADEFVIIAIPGTIEGDFRDIVGPARPNGNVWRVRHDSVGGQNRVVLLTTCPADLDGSHAVGLSDLTIVLANFGTLAGAGSEDGDFDGDGDVDLSDLTAFLANYGTACL